MASAFGAPGVFFDSFSLLGSGAKPRRSFFMKSESPTELPVVVGRAYDYMAFLAPNAVR